MDPRDADSIFSNTLPVMRVYSAVDATDLEAYLQLHDGLDESFSDTFGGGVKNKVLKNYRGSRDTSGRGVSSQSCQTVKWPLGKNHDRRKTQARGLGANYVTVHVVKS